MRDGALDGLRGLAVLLVLASHASFAGHDLVPGADMRGIGRAGVFLFFVLSSYLLTSQCLAGAERRRDGGEWSWGRFALRRVLRIAPAYAFTMALYVVLGAFEPGVALRHVAFVRSEGHFWTIPVEAWFYVTLPLVTFALAAARGTWARLGVAAVLAIVVRLLFPPDYPAKAPEFRPNVMPFLPVFLVGSAVAILRPRIEALRGGAGSFVTALGWLALAALVPLTPAVTSMIAGEPVAPTRFHLWFDVFAVMFGCVVAATVRRGEEPSSLSRVFSFAPLRAVGLVSYSLYLLHRVAFDFVESRSVSLGIPDALLGPAALAAALGLGTAAYFLVERPFLNVLRGRATIGA